MGMGLEGETPTLKGSGHPIRERGSLTPEET